MLIGPPIPLGILHSTTGTMALNETSLRDVMLMEVARVNAAGGLLGCPLNPVVLNPASDPARYHDMAEDMAAVHQVAAIFGCWTSASRKSVLPVLERTNTLLFYPLQYEGEEQSPNVFYLGSTPNQQAIPALEYLMSFAGGAFSRFLFIGTDYIYPRTTNHFLRSFLRAKGVSADRVPELYVPFGHDDWAEQMEFLQRFHAGGRCAIISTINGDSNLSFYKAVKHAGYTGDSLPIMAFSVSEAELQLLDPDDIAGHYVSWDYFMSNPAPENQAFLQSWRHFCGDTRPVYAPMACAVLGFRLWCKAVTAAGTTATDVVRQYMLGQTETTLSGRPVVMGINHHCETIISIGQATKDRQFKIIWSTPRPIAGDPWAAGKIITDTATADAQRNLLDALPSPLIVLDEAGALCYRSLSTYEYLGAFIKPEILQRLRDVIAAADPASGKASTDRLPEITVQDVAGQTKHMAITTGRMVFAGQPAFFLSLADVTYIRDIEDRLRLLNGQLQRLANTDSLTGVSNRRHFIDAVTAGLAQMRATSTPAALFLADIDYFKSVNDRFGHEAGDRALIQVAEKMRGLMNETHVFGRIGGEEFACFLPGTDIDGAAAFAEQLRQAVATLRLGVGAETMMLTCSFGVVSVDADTDTPESAMKRADAALYAAKRHGRNQVQLHESSVVL
jgi:urea transport system substrate-binding protein